MLLLIVLFIHFSLSFPLILYNNAKFKPYNNALILDNITQVYSQMDCVCLCYANIQCITINYFGTVQNCILFSVPLQYGNLSLMTTDNVASVLTFKNKTPSAPSMINNTNETIYSIWNTTAGQNSYPSSVGYSAGTYPVNQDAQQVFDSSVYTKYVAFGTCNSSIGATWMQCGANTGLYFSLQRGITLLLGFRFCTPNSYPTRDPILITVEGSNHPSPALTLGSSWTLIYNGSAGLDTDPGRYSCNTTQWISNNSIWYASYRILVLTKRDVGNFVSYSEVQLFGY